MLWERYPAYHERKTFTDLDGLLDRHASCREDFKDLREEYEANHYENFLVQLSWSDLAFRYATRDRILKREKFLNPGHSIPENPYVKAFMDQFSDLSTDRTAYFLFPESYVSQFFVVSELCKRADAFYPIRNLFPDEEKVHYLAAFDKKKMDEILLMFHLLYSNAGKDLYGGYSLYDYSLSWYQTHLREEGVVLRSPWLPDRLARYQGALPFHHNPVKTVYVRRNIDHIIKCGYFESELDFFISLTRVIMPLFQWWYLDISLYEEKDGYQSNWRLLRTRIRSRLTAEGIIKPRWKHELSLFHAVRKRYPDTLCQYRPDWLGRQSLDIYIPSLKTAIEYQGIQHYHPVAFFGGEEALALRQELDDRKRKLCKDNRVRLIEWPYDIPPVEENIDRVIHAS